jgi:predicted amidohydrolase YtcJ
MLCTRLTDARFLTMDPDHPVAHDLGIWKGRIAGLDEAVTSLPARDVVDLQGATVLPGFIDAHVHMAWTGLKQNDDARVQPVRLREPIMHMPARRPAPRRRAARTPPALRSSTRTSTGRAIPG